MEIGSAPQYDIASAIQRERVQRALEHHERKNATGITFIHERRPWMRREYTVAGARIAVASAIVGTMIFLASIIAEHSSDTPDTAVGAPATTISNVHLGASANQISHQSAMSLPTGASFIFLISGMTP